MTSRLILSLIAAASAAACTTPFASPLAPTSAPPGAAEEVAAGRPGTPVRLEAIDTLGQPRLQRIVADLPGGIQARLPVRFSRLVYRSSLDGRTILASALVALPEGDTAPKGVVLYLKGSDIPRSAAPTMPGNIWRSEAAVFAANGYALLIPDYIGFGAAPGPQAFLLTRENVADIRAALAALRQQRGVRGAEPLFVMGYSQGAQLASALHADLEQRPLAGYDLRATAAVAGPHELAGSLRRRLQPPLDSNPIAIGYVAWGAYTYAWRTGRSMEEVFQPRYAALVPRWFSGGMDVPQIAADFPASARDLFQPSFLRGVESDDRHWFVQMLRRNETWAINPRRPLRVILGEADDHVDPPSTRILVEHARARGGSVGLVAFPGLTHHQTGAAAFAGTLAWFDALAAGEDAAP
jgi:alpha-beta hydrolase superfamily lysophospholipase